MGFGQELLSDRQRTPGVSCERQTRGTAVIPEPRGRTGARQEQCGGAPQSPGSRAVKMGTEGHSRGGEFWGPRCRPWGRLGWGPLPESGQEASQASRRSSQGRPGHGPLARFVFCAPVSPGCTLHSARPRRGPEPPARVAAPDRSSPRLPLPIGPQSDTDAQAPGCQGSCSDPRCCAPSPGTVLEGARG